MKKIIENIFVVFMVILIMCMSVLLLSYNEFRVTEIGNKTLLILDEDMMDFKAGSLLVVEKKNSDTYKSGDYVFYYDTSKAKAQTVLAPIIDEYQKVEDEASYIVGDDYVLNDVYIIGKKENVKEYKNLGKVLSVLESKWGNLFLVVVPAFILFVYEIFNLFYEIKKARMKKKKVKIIEVDDEDEE